MYHVECTIISSSSVYYLARS